MQTRKPSLRLELNLKWQNREMELPARKSFLQTAKLGPDLVQQRENIEYFAQETKSSRVY